MAVDPKLAAGGVATVIIGGGTGYAITKTVSESKEESNQAPPRQPEGDARTAEEKTKAANKAAMKAKLTEAKFEVDETNEKCKAKLEIALGSDDTTYKQAIETCYENKDFSHRAKELKLTVLEVSKLDDNPENTEWKSKWDSKNAEIKKIDGGSNWASLSDAKTGIKTYCSTAQKITASINVENWKKYLNICTKDGTETGATLEAILKNDFWTNKPTTAV